MTNETTTQPEVQGATEVASATFHHVGFVVGSISQLGSNFARSLGAEWDGQIIHDPLQQARVTFLQCGESGNPTIELVEPDSEESPLKKFVAKGGGLHHICYEVDRLEAQLDFCRKQGSLIVRKPLPAAAFQGRRIAWVYTKQKLLVEYLERQR